MLLILPDATGLRTKRTQRLRRQIAGEASEARDQRRILDPADRAADPGLARHANARSCRGTLQRTAGDGAHEIAPVFCVGLQILQRIDRRRGGLGGRSESLREMAACR